MRMQNLLSFQMLLLLELYESVDQVLGQAQDQVLLGLEIKQGNIQI